MSAPNQEVELPGLLILLLSAIVGMLFAICLAVVRVATNAERIADALERAHPPPKVEDHR